MTDFALREARQTRTLRATAAGALLALTAILRAPSFIRPYLSDDESIYAAVARVIAHGGRLYVDAVDHKPPAIYWLYALSARAFGDSGSMVAIHLLLIGVVWATALVIGEIARRYDRDTPNVDRLAALLYIVFSMTMMSFDGLAANSELWMMLPAALSVMLVFMQPVGAARAFAAGVLLSVAATFKYQAGIQAPLLVAMLMLPATTDSVRARVRNAAAAIFGMSVVWLLLIAAFRMNGSLGEALYWFRFNFAYIGAGTAPAEMVRRAVPRIALVVGPAIVLYVAAAAEIRRAVTSNGDAGKWIVAWVVLSAVAVCAGGRFFGHYFHELTAPLAVLAAPAMLRAMRTSVRRGILVVGIALPAFVFWVADWSHDAVMRDIVHRPDPNYSAVVAWLDASDPAHGPLCVWGNSPTLVALARRPPGCRFVSANFLTGLSPATASQTDPRVDASPNIVPGMWPRFVDDLTRHRPSFIVDGSKGDVAYFGKFPPERYPELWTILEGDYEPVAVVEGMRIFRRRSGI